MYMSTLALGLLLIASIGHAQIPLVTLTVESHPDPTNAYPDSHLYLAFAKNVSAQRVYLPGAKLAGGYGGEGAFFPCVVEVEQQRMWRSIREIKLENVTGKRDPEYVPLEPGEVIEVCRALLPHQGGTRRASARFVLLRDWNVDAPRWVLSKTFTIQ